MDRRTTNCTKATNRDGFVHFVPFVVPLPPNLGLIPSPRVR